MRLEFCGANRTVTGSCHLLHVHGRKILLDCGLYQGPRDLAREINNGLPGVDSGGIDAIVLSHGHLDHCGRLPLLVHHGLRVPIYATNATIDVARVVLLDSAEIQEENAAYLNRRARDAVQAPDELVKPLYTKADALEALRLFKPVRLHDRVDLGGGVGFRLYDAGHILGSAYVVIDWKEPGGLARTLLFTADIGRSGSPILRDPEPPPANVDVVITESTYGGKKHAPVNDIEPQLLDVVKHAIDKRARVILPSFAVGRTQTVLWYLNKFITEKRIAKLPIYVDSPMGVELSKIHTEHRDHYDEETKQLIGDGGLFGNNLVTFAANGQQSRQINADRGPCVIIASSPTCEFGRVLHHLTMSIERPDDLVVFTGWIPPQTLGRRLQDGQKRVRILDRFYDVRCGIRTIHGLSAHADGEELMAFLKPALGPQTIAHIVHGEPDMAEAMAGKLTAAGVRVADVPAMTSSSFV
jgi:metallo-beta-lactamase family protein